MNNHACILYAEAHTPVGIFYGKIHKDPVDFDKCVDTRDGLQRLVESTTFLVIYADGPGGEAVEITLPGTIVKNSVIKFQIKRL